MNRLVPWAAWIGGILGWAVSHQLGSDLVQLKCAHSGWPAVLLIGVLGSALALGGALLSLGTVLSSADLSQPYVGARRFIAFTGVLAAGVFLLAILFQTMAAFIMPSCYG
jgi:hypothetical protein